MTLLQKILIALGIVGMLVFLAVTAYPAEYVVGDKITLQVIEVIHKTDGDGRIYYDIKHYGIKRKIKGILEPVFPSKSPYSLMLFVKLEKKDTTGRKYFYFNEADEVTIKKDSLTAVLKFRRKK